MPRLKAQDWNWKNKLTPEASRTRAMIGKLKPAAWRMAVTLATCSEECRASRRQNPTWKTAVSEEFAKKQGFESGAAFEANVDLRKEKRLAEAARELASAAYAGNSRAFRALADCIEFIRTNGVYDKWADPLSQQITDYVLEKLVCALLAGEQYELDEFMRTVRPFNVEEFIDDTGATYDRETIAKRARALGYLIIKALAQRNDSFGFEMRIGRLIANCCDMQPRHGAMYTDPRTGVVRQFDYQITLQQNQRKFVHVAIECKNLFKSAPAVLCGHLRTRTESFHDIALIGSRTHVEENSVQAVSVGGIARVSYASELFPTGSFVGKSVFCPQPPAAEKRGAEAPLFGYSLGRDSEMHDRWNQAVSSAFDMVGHAWQMARQSNETRCHLPLPIVVVPNGALWALEYDANGSIASEPLQVDRAELFRCEAHPFDSKLSKLTVTISHVLFATEGGLTRLLDSLHPDSTLWESWFPSAIVNRPRRG